MQICQLFRTNSLPAALIRSYSSETIRIYVIYQRANIRTNTDFRPKDAQRDNRLLRK
jgi:hypothetical protein